MWGIEETREHWFLSGCLCLYPVFFFYASLHPWWPKTAISQTQTPKVREKLISKRSSLTQDEAVKIAWLFKTSQAQLSSMTGSSTNACEETVHVVLNQNTRKWAQRNQPLNYQSFEGARMSRNCGRARSSPSNCPAGDEVCLSRKKSNHFADACRKRFQSVGQDRSRASSS